MNMAMFPCSKYNYSYIAECPSALLDFEHIGIADVTCEQSNWIYDGMHFLPLFNWHFPLIFLNN
jgi:hypothetical protein